MPFQFSVTSMGIVCVVFALFALSSYLRILAYLHQFDAGLENPPDRPHLRDKLSAYRDLCRERDRKPVLLFFFSVGVIGAFLCWFPLPWLVLASMS